MTKPTKAQLEALFTACISYADKPAVFKPLCTLYDKLSGHSGTYQYIISGHYLKREA